MQTTLRLLRRLHPHLEAPDDQGSVSRKPQARDNASREPRGN